MKFKIEQIAICPKDPVAARELLEAMGAVEWAEDTVGAFGSVYDQAFGENIAHLSFNYDIIAGNEFELLNYVDGPNWMEEVSRVNSVSHLGMHCEEPELERWRAFFQARGIRTAQEVNTTRHSNPVIDGKRKYHYCIFDTKAILGVDLKFIVRKDP